MFGAHTRDDDFYGSFREHAELASRAADVVVRIFQTSDGAADLARQVADAEEAGDRIVARVASTLRSTWITPLDRHLILDLSGALEAVLDGLHSLAAHVSLFRLGEKLPKAKELAQVVKHCCDHIKSATDLLPQKKRHPELIGLCAAISKLEGEADVLHREAVGALFSDGADPIHVFKWKDIFDRLELITDKCRYVSSLFEGIALET